MKWSTKNANIIQIKKYARVLGVSDMMARVLVNRGLNIEAAQALIENPAVLLETPEDIFGAEAAAAKIMEYLQKPGAEIWVFADYDVDGITSGYVMTDFLRRASDNEAFVYYPDRSEHYGLNMRFCDSIVARKEQDGVDILVVTVDNGIAALKEIKRLQQGGVEIVVTDHHQPQATLPNCIICDPHVNEDSAGHHLAGVGVAWKVCQLIDNAMDLDIIHEYLFAVAIGTVADVMPMTKENMALVNMGLDQLNSNIDCPKAFQVFKGHIDKDMLTATDIAWDVAPKLNACGRMGDIEEAAVLFYMNDSEKQEIIDAILNIIEVNEERKSHTKRAERAIEKMNFDNDYVCIFEANDYPSGIAGPVAGKIAEKFNKPAFVLQGKEVLIGSARSAGGISLQALLNIELQKGNIVSFGGHDAACGLNIKADMVDTFRQSMNESIAAMMESNEVAVEEPELIIDAEISLGEINNNVLKELNLVPYDKNTFAAPTFALNNLEVISTKRSKNNPNNICFTLKDMQGNMSQIWAWKFGDKYEALGQPERIDLAGSIDKDFMSKNKCTLKVIDLRAAS